MPKSHTRNGLWRGCWSAAALFLIIFLPCVLAGDATPDAGEYPPPASLNLQRVKDLARLAVDRWHALGCRGRGIKVAILDSGFRGYRQHLGTALPAKVLARSFRSDGNLEAKNSQHGILCAEVIHALAPDAELLLANWEPDCPDQFLAAVRWARSQGARLFSCSIIMPSWSDGEGGGSVHRELRQIIGNGSSTSDVLCFASAGNVAQRHWAGLYHPNETGWHEWAHGLADNELTPWGAERVSVELCWSTHSDYEVHVFDSVTGQEAGSNFTQSRRPRQCAVVRFDPQAGHTYQVRVRQTQGNPGRFHLVALGGGLAWFTPEGSIPFPGDGAEVIAVGAVDTEGHRIGYSSCGPKGGCTKPDLVAVVPFQSLWRPRPFSGTSAAAPQAAGVAALLWSLHPDWTANQVRTTLCRSARDLGPPGPDAETGFGLICLPRDELAAAEAMQAWKSLVERFSISPAVFDRLNHAR
jgi:hypothetical protein